MDKRTEKTLGQQKGTSSDASKRSLRSNKNIGFDCFVPAAVANAAANKKKGGDRKRKRAAAAAASRTKLQSSSAKQAKARDKWDEAWHAQYNKLIAFSKEHGHCDVPQRYEADRALGRWCKKQREMYTYFTGKSTKQKTTLTQERVRLLESINFSWETDGGKKRKVIKEFEVHIEELKEYKQQFGNCRVPHVYKPNPGLGVFVHRVKIFRREMNEGKRTDPNTWLTAERIQALDELEFEWSPGRWKGLPSWDERYQQLKAFHDRHGHCRVTKQYDEEHAPGLATWAQNQRYCLTSEKKLGAAVARRAEKKAALDKLGFSWVPPARWPTSWEERFAQLLEFHDRHGHCKVTKEYDEKEAPGLLSWISGQRKTLSSGKKMQAALASVAEKRAALDSLGFEWK